MDSTFLMRSKISGIRFFKSQIRAIHGTCYEGADKYTVDFCTFYGSGITLQRLDIYANGKRKGTPVH